jgi:hypothetical protein
MSLKARTSYFLIWTISSEDRKYLERTSDSSNKLLDQLCAHFYIMHKIHNSSWKPQPISYAGSFLYGLGKWLDKKLQPICRKLPTYCSSSFDLIADSFSRGARVKNRVTPLIDNNTIPHPLDELPV